MAATTGYTDVYVHDPQGGVELPAPDPAVAQLQQLIDQMVAEYGNSMDRAAWQRTLTRYRTEIAQLREERERTSTLIRQLHTEVSAFHAALTTVPNANTVPTVILKDTAVACLLRLTARARSADGTADDDRQTTADVGTVLAALDRVARDHHHDGQAVT